MIGRNSTLGSGATVPSNIKLWPDKSVASGAIVSMSLIYGIKWPGSLFGDDGVAGLGQHRDHAGVRAQARASARLGAAAGPERHDQPRRAPGIAPDESLRHRRAAQRRHQRSRPARECRRRFRATPSASRATPACTPGFRRATPSSSWSSSSTRAASTSTRTPSGRSRTSSSAKTSGGRRWKPSAYSTFPERTLEAYTSGFLNALAPRAISDANMRVVIDYAFGNASLILPRILSNLNVEMIALNAYFDNTKVLTFGEQSRAAPRAARQRHDVAGRQSRHSAGSARRSARARRRPRPHDRRSRLFALVTMLVAQRVPGARIAVPVMAPTRAGNGRGRATAPRVVRTRSDRRSLMASGGAGRPALAFAGGANYELIFPEFQPVFDSLYAAAKIMELLATPGSPLVELVDELPAWHLASRRVHCPWDRKGQIMRTAARRNARRERRTHRRNSNRTRTGAGFSCSPMRPIRISTSTPKAAPTTKPAGTWTRSRRASKS